MSENSIGALVGLTLTRVVGEVGGDAIIFESQDGRKFRLYHVQDCCECVLVEDICGNLSDLVGTPIIRAEEVQGEIPVGFECSESCTWTFYKIDTVKGGVTIRWLGESNGYYSESVDFGQLHT